MKKVVLVALCFVSAGALAQTFTVNDTLSVNDGHLYYTADSNAVNLSGVTGAGVTWDYSNLAMYPGATNYDTIRYAADSPDFTDYPNARYHDDMAGGISHYFKNYADSVVSYGFVFTAQGNTVKMKHDVDPEKIMILPMSLNDTFTDSTYGHADISGNISNTAGDVVVTADGTGTLLLGSSTFNNVIRIKMVETIETSITFPFPLTGSVTRTTFTYYDLATQSQPLFIHSTIDADANIVSDIYTACYSAVPLGTIGVEEDVIGQVQVYPNPASAYVIIESQNADQLILVNALGETVATYNKPQNKTEIDLSNFETGIYFVKIKQGGAEKTEKLIVK